MRASLVKKKNSCVTETISREAAETCQRNYCHRESRYAQRYCCCCEWFTKEKDTGLQNLPNSGEVYLQACICRYRTGTEPMIECEYVSIKKCITWRSDSSNGVEIVTRQHSFSRLSYHQVTVCNSSGSFQGLRLLQEVVLEEVDDTGRFVARAFRSRTTFRV